MNDTGFENYSKLDHIFVDKSMLGDRFVDKNWYPKSRNLSPELKSDDHTQHNFKDLDLGVGNTNEC